MMKAHRIRLHPTAEQENYFARAAGTARFVWNWALQEWQKQYEAWKADQENPKAERKMEKPTALRLKKQFNALWRWQDITLADRTFVCQQCGIVQDRDVNAARNIFQEALRLLVEIQQTEAAFGTGSDKA